MTVNYMDIKEFCDLGYLQEVNRQFFHPLGLALEVTVEDDGSQHLSGVWDYRDDPEGMIFGMRPDPGKAIRVEEEYSRHVEARLELMGSIVQPLDWPELMRSKRAN
jgi:hypothetical protein